MSRYFYEQAGMNCSSYMIQAIIVIVRRYFFNTWFTDFFLNIKVGVGKKIKIKITKKNFLYNLFQIWIGEKKKKLYDFRL